MKDFNKMQQKRVMIKNMVLLAALAATVVPFFQNCGQGFEVTSSGSLNSGGIPALEALDANCMTNTNYDACIYYKNPLVHILQVAKIGVNIGDAYEDDYLARGQTYAVRLEGLLSPAFLTSDDFSVYDKNGQPATTASGWRVPYAFDQAERLGQLSSYFYAEKVNRFLLAHDRPYLYSKGVRIVTDTDGTGWSFARNTIYLSAESAGVNSRASLDGSVVTHLVTEAAIAHATQGAVYNLAPTETKHVDCGSSAGPVYTKDCCASNRGCSKAVTAGLADHMVAVLFPQYAAVGDYFARDPAGAGVCTRRRDVATMAMVTADGAYASCGDTIRNGQVFVMGSFYASIWSKIRARVKAEKPAALDKFDALFAETLSLVTANDDFVTMLQKVRDLDQEKYAAQFGAYFTAEYSARGLASL